MNFFPENNIFNSHTTPLPTVPRIAAVVMSSPTKLAHCGREAVLSWYWSLVPQPTCSWNPVTSQLGNPTMMLLLSGCTTTRWNRLSTMIGIFWKLPPCTLCHQSVLYNYSTYWKINIRNSQIIMMIWNIALTHHGNSKSRPWWSDHDQIDAKVIALLSYFRPFYIFF